MTRQEFECFLETETNYERIGNGNMFGYKTVFTEHFTDFLCVMANEVDFPIQKETYSFETAKEKILAYQL